MKRIAALFAVIALLATDCAALAQPDEKRSTLDDQKEVSVTIYDQNLGLVRDRRTVKFDEGENVLAFRDVSAQIRPETALIKDISHPDGFYVIEQNFDFDLLTPQKLLEKYVGRKVGIIKTHPTTGEETEEAATVLSANNGVVLKVGDRIETGVPGRIVYRDIPETLRDRPTLVLNLHSPTSGTHDVELSYLTSGLGWVANYVAGLDSDEKSIVLNGWVTLTNTSGTTYKDAKLQLVAGDVNRVRETRKADMVYEGVNLAKAAAAPQMAEEALFEYHLYTLDRPTTIKENQTKQVALLSAAAVPVKKEYLLMGQDYYYGSSYGEIGQKMKVGVYIEFMNKKQDGLGIPLPKGVVRVYKNDSAGNAQFVGEDKIDHTPKNEKVRLKLGDAFDVTADKKQTDFKKVGDRTFESAYEVVLKNAKPEAVTVKVQEPMPGDWTVVSESHKHTKEAAGTAVWMVDVPAEGSAKLTYRVRVRFL
jgi:hypothetical protein